MKEDYRDLMYKNDYANVLSDGQQNQTMEKAALVTRRYFKRNYLPRFPVNKDAAILDVGCGRGQYLQVLKEFGYTHIEGVDLAPSNVEICLEKGLVCHHTSVQEYLIDSRDRYDVILFNDMIEHLHKQECTDVLQLLYQALKPGGMLVVKTINAANPYLNGTGRYIVFDHENSFVDYSLRQVLRACGFSDVIVTGTDIYVIYGVIGMLAKALAACICLRLRFLNHLFGRTSVRVFSKDLIAFAYKQNEQ